MILETRRLLLRPISARDKNAVFAYRSDALANKYQSWIPNRIAEVEAFIEKKPEAFNLPGSWFQLVMVRKIDQVLIGDLGLHFTGKHNRQVELGCTLCKNSQKLGYATEATSGVIDHLFNQMDKHRIMASVDPRNIPSVQLFERLGFRKEAHFRESLLLNGAWVDDVIYALLQKDWRANWRS